MRSGESIEKGGGPLAMSESSTAAIFSAQRSSNTPYGSV